ncbi:Calcineurin-like phosphoesterase [Stieleria neptunia]|uniref:Calcineurin-like phosphoesterase n=1 Tax=Stieleria neptunia TaxID=2527979 RepID=A0A518HW97_9BACT|nr:metallophosphoesterase [Stieleria neptunia]QDV45130.1 Calcineurin-like phosphoesterase [Stieleria neptunia]
METTIPTADRVVVISDLHITPAARMGNFDAGGSLVRWAKRLLADEPKNQILVLNGDIVDFLLLESRPARFELSTAPALVATTLDRIAKQMPWASDWRAGLRAWLALDNRIVLLSGNHDPEWLHPDTTTILRRWIAGSDAQASEDDRIEIWRHAKPWLAKVGRWDVVVAHGHRADPVNDIDPHVVHQALADGQSDLRMPAGSELVLGPINVFKRAMDPISGRRRFPFLDSVKPEFPGVLLLLLYLDAGLVRKNLPDQLRPLLRVLMKQIRGQLFGGAGLAVADASNVSDAIAEQMGQMMAQHVWESIDESDRKANVATMYKLEQCLKQSPIEPESDQPIGLLASHGGFEKTFLRAWLRAERTTSTTFFDTAKASGMDREIMNSGFAMSNGPNAVVAGHTHAARRIDQSANHVYLNSGTWTRLLDLSRFDDSDESMIELIDAIEHDQIELMERRSWVEILPTGPTLHLSDS